MNNGSETSDLWRDRVCARQVCETKCALAKCARQSVRSVRCVHTVHIEHFVHFVHIVHGVHHLGGAEGDAGRFAETTGIGYY